MSVSTFSVFGCCPSRDLFNSKINNNYKNYFKILHEGYHQSVISLMSEPLMIDKNDFLIKGNFNFRSERTMKDFNKNYLDELKNNPPEFLLLDFWADVEAGLLVFNDKFVTNSSFYVQRTDFYNNLKNKILFNIQNNTKEYLNLWKKKFKEFNDFLYENCPNTKVILNPINYDSNGNCLLVNKNIIEVNEKFKLLAERCNPYYDYLHKYVCNHFDFDVLIYGEYMCSDVHPWGLRPAHFQKKFYKDLNFQLINIVERYNDLSEELNTQIRKREREELLFDLYFKKNLGDFKLDEYSDNNDLLTVQNYYLKKEVDILKKLNSNLLNLMKK